MVERSQILLHSGLRRYLTKILREIDKCAQESSHSPRKSATPPYSQLTKPLQTQSEIGYSKEATDFWTSGEVQVNVLLCKQDIDESCSVLSIAIML
jgi:hypothetical protein